jgi:hypothetical protein
MPTGMGAHPTLVALALALLASPAAAQSTIPPGRADEHSGVRGLSPREIDDLASGRGLGLARAADLNGYPGPRHVLDAATSGELRLAPPQREAIERVFADMSAEARRLGAAVLAEEAALEETFRAGRAEPADLESRLGRLAALQAALRGVHLVAHLRTRNLLDERQIARYQELRGHATEPQPVGPAAGHRHGP